MERAFELTSAVSGSHRLGRGGGPRARVVFAGIRATISWGYRDPWFSHNGKRPNGSASAHGLSRGLSVSRCRPAGG